MRTENNFNIKEEKMKIQPRQAKLISVKQALEWLAMGWVPYVDNDDRLAPEDRESIRCPFTGEKIKKADEHFYSSEQLRYNHKMYKAVGALENLLNTNVIQLNNDCILSVGDFPTYVGRRTLSKAKNVWGNKRVDAKENNIYFYADFDECENCYCETVGKCFDFSELRKIEPYFEQKEEVKKRDKAIDNDNYTTPEIEVINMMIAKYGDKINQETRESVLLLIEKETKNKGYSFSDRQKMAIFTVIRKPETKTGGAKKQGRTPDL